MKTFFKDMFSNPDGSYSTKRVAGFVFLTLSAIIGLKLIFYPNPASATVDLGVFYGFLGASLGAFGISSFDALNYFKNTQIQK